MQTPGHRMSQMNLALESANMISEGDSVGQQAFGGLLGIDHNQAGDGAHNISSISEKGSTGTESIMEETCYGGSTAPYRGPVFIPPVVTVSAEHEAIVLLPPSPPAPPAFASVPDQTPGQPGLIDNSDGVAWKCLIIGCGTSNSNNDPQCASCHYGRPTAEHIRRAKVYQQAAADSVAKDKQALAAMHKELSELRSKHSAPNYWLYAMIVVLFGLLVISSNPSQSSVDLPFAFSSQNGFLETSIKPRKQHVVEPPLQEEKALPVRDSVVHMQVKKAGLQARSQAQKPSHFDASVEVKKQESPAVVELLSKIDLLKIARSGDVHLLQELDGLGALGSLQYTVNKIHSFVQPGYSAKPMTTLMIACFKGNADLVQILLKVPGVDVNWQGGMSMENTALMFASAGGFVAIVEALLADGRVEVNMHDQRGWTALIYASDHCRTSVVRALLTNSTLDVNLRSPGDGWTALIRASFHGYTAVVETLLADVRVNASVEDNEGMTALDIAKEYKQTDVVALLAAGDQGTG